MKTLLVTSPHLDHSVYHQDYSHSNWANTPHYAQTFAPMGLISLAGAAQSVADIKIVDINKAINSSILPMSQHFYQTTAEWLLGFKPDLIGFMTECDSYHHLIRICQSIKAINPTILTLFGGVSATVTHLETVRDFSAVDFVIRGEGELAFLSFIESLKGTGDFREVGNLTYRNGENIISNPEQPLIHDLDTLPWPDFSRIDLDPQDAIWIEIGRGCPFKCNFCVTAPYWKRKHRIKSAERIIRELTYLKNSYQRTDFNFTHDLFTTDRRWVLQFCRQLAESELNVTWTCSSRTDTLDEELIYWLQRAGCRDIYFGVETGTAEMQARIDKNLDLNYANYIIRKTKESKINVTVGLISGLPGESDISLRGTLKSAHSFLRLPGSTVHLFGYNPYRGSPIFEIIKDNLVFDEHFVDFPLSEETHLENCEIIKNHFEIFSRYSRMSSYENINVEVIRSAEEYLPIISVLRSLVLILEDQGVDPLILLMAWTSWIVKKNKFCVKPNARMYYGTIKDFLVFSESYIQEQNIVNPVVKEIIQWEHLKEQFRSKAYSSPLVKDYSNVTKLTLYTNPSAVITTFEHANKFLSDKTVTESGTFVFYARSNDTAEIVRISPIVHTILDIANHGITATQLVNVINEFKEESFKSLAPTNEAISGLLEQLEQLELLLRVN